MKLFIMYLCLFGSNLANGNLKIENIDQQFELLDKINEMYDRGEDVERFVKENELEHLLEEREDPQGEISCINSE